jgi:hypothetical protein
MNEVFNEATPDLTVAGDMIVRFRYARVAWACRLLSDEARKVPARRRRRVIAEHLGYFNLPVPDPRSR